MKRRLLLALLGAFTGLASTALAAPIYLNKTEAVAAPRKDSGTGVCGSVIKFVNQPSPIGTVDDAALLLNRPMDDPNIVGRVSRLFQSMNMSIGAGSEADFRAPMYSDEIFPYCQDPGASPMGQNDYNIAMRVRGYLNVTDTANGQPMTFALNCDDGCGLRIGASHQVVMTADERSPQLTGRRARSVVFQDPGLYPFEIVYYQNATSGYLECSKASTMSFASDDTAISNVQWTQQSANFKPLSGAELFSAVEGTSAECQECGETGPACAGGNYCGDGLCQACNVADHCGPSCAACPSDRRICQAGKCLACTSDDMCASGGRCDVASGTCQMPVLCASGSDCQGSDVCRPEGFCGTPPKPCTASTECQSGQICACEDGAASCGQKTCFTPPKPCTSANDCPMNYACDDTARICKVDARYLLTGGGFACSVRQGAQPSRNPLGLLAPLGLALLGLSAGIFRRRQARKA